MDLLVLTPESGSMWFLLIEEYDKYIKFSLILPPANLTCARGCM